ncbi:MAG: putative immunity protein [Dehalococcoidia bacterium]
MNHWTDELVKLNACSEATEWARTQPDLATAWSECQRGDWMLWLAGKLAGPVGDPRRRLLVGAAAECARLALPLFEAKRPGDGRVRACLDTCDRFAAGDEAVTIADLRAAAYAAYAAAAAAADAYAAYAAAAAAADAAADADAAYAADAADAADAAYAADAADAADAARVATLAQCADIVRRWYPAAPALEVQP